MIKIKGEEMEKGEPIVVVKEVGKNYGTVEALKDVSFVVERGVNLWSDRA